MTIRTINKEKLPKDAIIMWDKSGTLPPNFSHETVLFSKFVKQVPTAATNPGTAIGVDSHSEPSTGPSHTHPYRN